MKFTVVRMRSGCESYAFFDIIKAIVPTVISTVILADASLHSYPSYFLLNIILLEDLQVKRL